MLDELARDASQIGVWEHDLETHMLLWDDRVNEIYGKPQDGKPRGYQDWAGAIHPEDLDRASRDFEEGMATAARAIDDGEAAKTLTRWIEVSNATG